jgi:hypothetical protein
METRVMAIITSGMTGMNIEVGGQMSEVGSQKSEVGRCKMNDER